LILDNNNSNLGDTYTVNFKDNLGGVEYDNSYQYRIVKKYEDENYILIRTYKNRTALDSIYFNSKLGPYKWAKRTEGISESINLFKSSKCGILNKSNSSLLDSMLILLNKTN
jgi:hypothetical protein